VSSTEVRQVATRSRTFQHEALLYAGEAGFLDGALPFIREGLARGEPTLVVVDAIKIAALVASLGDRDAGQVHFADMAQVGRNPARIIPRWREFVDAHLAPGRPVRGIGEPIWAGRSPEELIECQAHETLLNLAFADSPAWSLLCPYNVEALAPAVVDEARRSHPYLVRDGSRSANDEYLQAHPSPSRLDHPLPPAPGDAELVVFGHGRDSLATVRDLVRQHALRCGLDRTATDSLILAANEVAANSLRHGAGHGTLRLWGVRDSVVCEIHDEGHLSAPPMLGRERPRAGQAGGHGIWLANQLCDLVQIRSTPAGTTVRLYIARAAG
jgi:anti-sigma regulatory factor (Ser/Thr protein kinase)